MGGTAAVAFPADSGVVRFASRGLKIPTGEILILIICLRTTTVLYLWTDNIIKLGTHKAQESGALCVPGLIMFAVPHAFLIKPWVARRYTG